MTLDRSFWEERWAQALGRHADEVAQRPPNAHLVAELHGLPPGIALDAGCGHGSDTLWLAARGWQVTAVDFSETALAHARSTAEAAGTDVAERIDRSIGRQSQAATTSWPACMSTWRPR